VKKILAENLTGNAARMGEIMDAGLQRIQQRHANMIGHYSCRGLVGGLQMTQPGKKKPNPDLAHNVIERCFHKGLLFFAPVGAWGQTVKIAPPLTIPEAAVREGLTVLGEAVDEAVAALRRPAHAKHPEPQTNGVLG
jgi:4-aminobutyrate aminotransferase/diaminobutyrate-pyruvate transaminase/4-aminobutyrate aminotransferase/(S)-3-amino-2-methylpropionate transaminase